MSLAHIYPSCLFPTTPPSLPSYTAVLGPAASSSHLISLLLLLLLLPCAFHIFIYSPLSAAVAERRWWRAQLSWQFTAEIESEKRTWICRALSLPVTIIYTAPPGANTHSIMWFVNIVQHKRSQCANRERKKSNGEGQRRRGVTGNRYDCYATTSFSSPCSAICCSTGDTASSYLSHSSVDGQLKGEIFCAYFLECACVWTELRLSRTCEVK